MNISEQAVPARYENEHATHGKNVMQAYGGEHPMEAARVKATRSDPRADNERSTTRRSDTDSQADDDPQSYADK